MTSTYNNTYWPVHPLTGRRPYGWQKIGVKNGDRVTPYAYSAYGGRSDPFYYRINGSYAGVDMPNARPCTSLRGTSLKNLCISEGLVNRSYERLVSRMRDGPASLGETLVQWREAAEGVEHRAGQLYHLARGIAEGHKARILYGLAGNRNVGNVQRLVKSLKRTAPSLRLANYWLEFSFGWAPLVGDIYDYCQVWSKDLPAGTFRGVAKGLYYETWGTSAARRSSCSGTLVVLQQARVSISNPNLYLLEEMGLANPALTAWNVLPWSFLGDWLFDVSSYISSLTDFLGCNVEHPFTTFYGYGSGTDNQDYGNQYPFRVSGWGIERQGGLIRPTPNIHIVANVGSSWKRAANAVSLARQLFR